MKTIRASEEEVSKALSQLTLLMLGTQVGGSAVLIGMSIWQFHENVWLTALVVLGMLTYMVIAIVVFWRGSRARLASWRNSWLVIEDEWIEKRCSDGVSIKISRVNLPQVQENTVWMNVYEVRSRSYIGIPRLTKSDVFSEMRSAVSGWQMGGALASAENVSREA